MCLVDFVAVAPNKVHMTKLSGCSPIALRGRYVHLYARADVTLLQPAAIRVDP